MDTDWTSEYIELFALRFRFFVLIVLTFVQSLDQDWALVSNCNRTQVDWRQSTKTNFKKEKSNWIRTSVVDPSSISN